MTFTLPKKRLIIVSMSKITYPNIVLIGFMGTGKSAVADYLSGELGIPIIDIDQMISESENKSITDIFATDGEAYFRGLESSVLSQLANRVEGGSKPLYSPREGRFACARAGFTPAPARLGKYSHYAPLCIEKSTIISCGGGIVMTSGNIEKLKEIGCVVLLTASPQTIFTRVEKNDERPLLDGRMNKEFITELLERRSWHYQRAADIVIDTDGKSIPQVGEELLERMRRRQDYVW